MGRLDAASGVRPTGPARPAMRKALHVFAGKGPLKLGGLADCARREGVPMDELDVLQDTVGHDVEREEVSEPLVEDSENGVYGHGHYGVPCTTFTPMLSLSRTQKRSRTEPWGISGISDKHQRQVDASNLQIDVTIASAKGIVDTGGEVTIESISDYGDRDGPCFWPARAKMCPLAKTPQMVWFIAYAGLRPIHVPLCRFRRGGPRKWITIWCTPGAYAILEPLLLVLCTHSAAEHGSALGHDADGVSNATKTASYPEGLCIWLAVVAAWACRKPEGSAGKEITWGAALHPEVRKALDAQRRRPPPYASRRKLRPMEAEDRRHALIPCPHDTPAETSGEIPDRSWTVTEEGEDDERRASWPTGSRRPPRPNHGGIPGAPEGKVTYEMLWRRVPEKGNQRVGLDIIRSWMHAAMVAAVAMAKGQDYKPPPDVDVPADLKEEWARPWLIDSRDHMDCVVARRSTRHTIFDGGRQMDRRQFRRAGEEVGWYAVDPDIMDQGGEGGIESRSFLGRCTRLRWHGMGATLHFEAANAIAVQALADAWMLGPFEVYPPFEPIRCISQNVLMQQRSRPDESMPHGIEYFEKPRVLANLSGGEDDPNSGVLKGDRSVVMPSPQTHAQGCGVVHAWGAPAGLAAEQMAIDMTSAYEFLCQQRTDWWEQCTFWAVLRPDGKISAGWFIKPRVVFGGASGPNRFGRLSRVKRAVAYRRQRAFDELHPFPEAVAQVRRERAAMQRSGLLPEGVEQLAPASLQAFIDDETGSGLNDIVPMPRGINVTEPQAPRYIDVLAFLRNTLAEGGRPSQPGTRIVAYCVISIHTTLELGFEVAKKKILCGDRIVVLGLRVDAREDKHDVPPAKAVVMLAELGTMEQSLQAEPFEMDREMVERTVGRLNHVAQIDPAVLHMLSAGYAIACSAGQHRRHGRGRPRWVRVRPDRRVGRQFLEMVAASTEALEANAGVPLLFIPHFADVSDLGSWTTQTDASGEDGIGGFAFVAGRPKEIWVVASAWPTDILTAVKHAALRRAQKEALGPHPVCAMPACELFGPIAMVISMMADVSEGDASWPGEPPLAVLAALDCKPAAAALSSERSSSALMRSLIVAAQRRAPQWMGAHVFREFNTDADLLSHPEDVHRVVAVARQAGWTVHWREVVDAAWEVLREGIAEAGSGESAREVT